MSDHRSIALGNQRNGECTSLTQRADDVLLVVACVLRLAKSGNGDGFNGGRVSGGFGANQHV